MRRTNRTPIALCILSLALCGFYPASAQSVASTEAWNRVSGHVFADANGNASFDRIVEAGDTSEPGIEGVLIELIQDGYVIGATRTDATGLYEFGGPARANLVGSWSLAPATEYSVRVALTDPALRSPARGKSVRRERPNSSRTQFASASFTTGQIGDLSIHANFGVGSEGPVAQVEIPTGSQPTQEQTPNAIDFGMAGSADVGNLPIPEGTVPGIVKIYDVINIPNDGIPAQRGLWIRCLDLSAGSSSAVEYEMIDTTLTVFDDGTASLIGRAELPGVGAFKVDFFYYGRTEVPPPGSPKLPGSYTPDTSAWIYYTGFYGNLQGVPGTPYEGARINILGDGPAFQIGEGGSLFTPDGTLGASAWFTWNLVQNSSPASFRDESECDSRGDINVDLQCRPEGCAGLNVLDRFNTVSYNNDDGSIPWDGPWEERDVFHNNCYRSDDDDDCDDHSPASTFGGNGPEQAPIYVQNGQLRLSDRPDTGELPKVIRCVDLTGAESATLSFDHFRPDNLEDSDKIEAWVLDGDTGMWRRLLVLIGDNYEATTGHEVFDITDEISSETCIKFRVKQNVGGSNEFFGIDNVEICTARCGDSVVNGAEQCDDGNGDEGDGCRADCTVESCGDGLLDPGEACDDGNTLDGDGCESDCSLPNECGDAMLDPGEACDDGNGVAGDGCRPDCTVEVCGDGIRDLIEQCDDGNLMNGDGCSSMCTVETGPPVRPLPLREDPTSSSGSGTGEPNSMGRRRTP